MSEKLFFVFDVESVGLHGEGYAYGYVVVDHNGNEIECGESSCDPKFATGDEAGRKWIAENCPKLIAIENHPRDVQFRFVEVWYRWKAKGVVMVADCPWPVEATFLRDCVRRYDMQGPYPLIDVGSVVLAAGGDPIGTFDRKDNELPKHDPLCDARQSARILIQHLKRDDPAAALVAKAREAVESLKISDAYLGWGDCSLENVHNRVRATIHSLAAALDAYAKGGAK